MTEKQRKVTLCVDFDGVVHGYQSGWQGDMVIPDPPVPGAFDWLAELILSGKFDVCIYSSRSKNPDAIVAMKKWFGDWNFGPGLLAALKFPSQKPAAFLTIDDRAICFSGAFPTQEEMLEFVPWHKKKAPFVPMRPGDTPITPDDEGKLSMIAFIDKKSNNIIVDFNKEVKWMGFDANSAEQLASRLLQLAVELRAGT